MKTLISLLSIVALTFAGASAQVKPVVKPTIVGSWKVRTTGVIWKFTPDGKMTTSNGSNATWKPNLDDASKCEVAWSGAVYSAVVDPLGKAIQLSNAGGKSLEAERLPDAAPAADPVIGVWKELGVVGTWTFRADGSVVSNWMSRGKSRSIRGTWKAGDATAFERKYEILWLGGASKYSGGTDRSASKMKFKADDGRKFELERVETAKSE